MGGGGLAVLLVAGAFVLWPRPDRITRVNFDRIRQGMSLSEVAAVLGPPGDYTTAPRPLTEGFTLVGVIDPEGKTIFLQRTNWSGDSGSIWIGFDSDGIAVFTAFTPPEHPNQGTLENLLWRAKRQWGRSFPGKQ